MNITIKALNEAVKVEPQMIENYNNEIRVDVDQKKNFAICIVPELEDKKETIEATMRLAISSRPALVIFDMSRIEGDIVNWQGKMFPRTEMLSSYQDKKDRIVKYWQKTLEAARFSKFEEHEDAYVYAQMNSGLLWR